MKILFLFLGIISGLVQARSFTDLPRAFDLRSVNGANFVSAVKKQSGGTCWTHGTIASIESNLMKTGTWLAAGETEEAALAEYHLDWWNGFNQHYNADIAPSTGGITVHQGGDYRVASAYFARGEGAVRKSDGQSYSSPPERHGEAFHYFYVRDIDWLSMGDGDHSAAIKNALMKHGAVGTAITWSNNNYSSDTNTFYQSPNNESDPNHAVTIVGWNDDKETQAVKPGAWLVKNSWGSGWGDGGFFWISYDDKISGKHPEMGAVSFNNVEPMRYHKVYYHDYHGWRDTRKDVTEAFNAFVADGKESLKSLSFYTAANNAWYQARVYTQFDGEKLDGLIAEKYGVAAYPGHHTVDLPGLVALGTGQKFYVYLKLFTGGHPIDKTSNVPLLLGRRYRAMVTSTAAAGESFYRKGGSWVDLTKDDASANFCMKALTVTP